jgi:LacI family transcriptional regulator
MKVIARKARVSVATASRVLTGRGAECRISLTAARRVRTVAEKLGYQPNLQARSLRTQRTQTIGLLVTELANPFFATIAGAVETAASAAGYGVVIATSGEDEKRELDYLHRLCARPTDGLIVAPAAGKLVRLELERLAKERFPLLVVDRFLDGLACDRVLTQNCDAAMKLVMALTNFGCRRPAFAGGPANVWTALERERGFRQGLKEAGFSIIEEFIQNGAYSIEHGRAVTEVFLKERNPPDGIIAANNKILVGVLEALAAAGEPARNIAVAGFDGVPFASFLGRPIAVAEQPEKDIGRLAAEMLIERIEGRRKDPREVVLPINVRVFTPQSITGARR